MEPIQDQQSGKNITCTHTEANTVTIAEKQEEVKLNCGLIYLLASGGVDFEKQMLMS